MSKAGYSQLADVTARHDPDFDGAYQFSVARENTLAIATQDKDFQRTQWMIGVRMM